MRRCTVLLQLAGLGAVEAAKWEQRLNRETRACGCEAGALGMVVGIALLLGFAVTHRDAFITSPKPTAIAAALLVVMSALAGKSLGLLAARRRLVHALRELQQLLELRPARELK